MPKLKANSITIIEFVSLALLFCLIFTPPASAYFLIKLPQGISNQPPKAVAISPVSGTFTAQTSKIFGTAYSDANGWKDIQYTYFMINTSANGSKCFFGYYNQITNKLYLRNDSNTAWIGGFAPGSGNTIENSYVKLDCSHTTISRNGTILIIRWSITFTNKFAGTKNAYLYVRDTRGAYNGWVKKGTFTIIPNNQPPQINSITPVDQATILAGAKINIQVNASDPDSDPLEYQFSIGGAVKQAWSSTNTYSWQTTVSDTGPSGLICEVRDNKGLSASQTATYQIINPTVEEILQRVTDNYALIYDLKADLTLTATLNNEPYGSPDYNRYYFKAPDKEKTDAFSEEERQNKTQTFITNGSNFYLIDIINKTTQSVDLLNEVNINSAQFSQMDLYYNQANFLNSHTITENYADSDLSNFIIALDALPKTPNNIYTRLEFYIDYNKGLISKIACYKNEELPQITQVTETKQMPNGAWVVSKLQKNPNLTAGNLIVTLTYDNININSGLTDSDFDPTQQY